MKYWVKAFWYACRQAKSGRVEMSGAGGEVRQVSNAQLQAIENQLFSLVRQQAKRNHPIELPRQDFWNQVATLLSTIDVELSEVGRSEGWSVKSQNLSRRQGNVRRAVADLTQHRLTAFVRHASTNNLASAPYGDALGEVKGALNPLDWQRHDAAERAFYEGLNGLIEKYKHHVSWSVLQKGLEGDLEEAPVIPRGTVQLDHFVKEEGGLTGQGPPKVVEKLPEMMPYLDPDEDEEERIARMSAYPTSGMVKPDVHAHTDTQADLGFPTLNPGVGGGDDFLEANPSLSQPQGTLPTIEETEIETEIVAKQDETEPALTEEQTPPQDENGSVLTTEQTPPQDENAGDVEDSSSGLIRIKMLQDLPAPIVDADGKELELMEGDVEFCESDFAAGLIAAGFAEDASL